MFDYRKMWKHLVSNRNAEAHHVVQYIVFKALDKAEGNVERAINYALQALCKAFTPVSNQNRVINGHEPLYSLYEAIWKAHWPGREILGAPSAVMSFEERQKFNQVLAGLYNMGTLKEYYQRRYVYIFVRQDISPEYQLVQASHVALKLGFQVALDHSLPHPVDPSNLYFSVIGAKDLAELGQIQDHLKQRGITHHVFVEPDIGDQITAVASYPVLAKNRGSLLNYKRLKFQ